MSLRVYIDTSVIGGYYDKEFEKDTKLFFERIKSKDFIIYLSEIRISNYYPHLKKLKT